MIFFSGFGFASEEQAFAKWLDGSRFSVAGFSMGAIDAIEYALSEQSRVDKIILFSPAYFCGIDEAKKAQEIITFQKHPDVWFKLFYSRCGLDAKFRCKDNASVRNLEKLLFYDWSYKKLEGLIMRGTSIDVYFGEQDKIINILGAKHYFAKVARQNIIIKNVGHSLSC